MKVHVPFSAIVDALNQVPDKIKPDIETLAMLIRNCAADLAAPYWLEPGQKFTPIYPEPPPSADIAEFEKAMDEYAARRWNQDRRTRVLAMYRAAIARAEAAEARVNALIDALDGDSHKEPK